jgi:hypothetical protein
MKVLEAQDVQTPDSQEAQLESVLVLFLSSMQTPLDKAKL